MRKTILAAVLVAPAAFAQSTDQSPSNALKVRPSVDTPAKQKERNQDYSKVPGMPGNKIRAAGES